MAETENKNPKKQFVIFVLKFVLFILLATAAYQLLFWFLWKSEAGPDAYDSSYQRAMLRQIYALEDPNRDPEVIIFGSSYVPYGIDTATIEESLGDGTKVQILGIEAAIGIPYLIDVLKEDAKPGDTVVYILGESNPTETSIMSISAALEPDKEKLLAYWDKEDNVPDTYLTWRKLYALTVATPLEMVRSRLSDKKQVYEIDSFDERGNMVVERLGTEISPNTDRSDTIDFDELKNESFDALNDFKHYCDENDITFVITYSPTVEESWKEDEEMFRTFDKNVEDYMEADVLGGFEDFFLPAEYFYNHPLHLNSEGARIYSGQVAEKLREYRQKQ